MKKLLFLLLFIPFISCEPEKVQETDTEKYDRWMSELECPIILIAKTDKAIEYPAIVVRDGAARVRTIRYVFRGGSAASIADSRSIGDTLKPCK